jgi:hypothetical protein
MGSAAFAEVEAEPDWNEAGLRLQDYMEEYADCPETLAMLEGFLERNYDDLVGEMPAVAEEKEVVYTTGLADMPEPPMSVSKVAGMSAGVGIVPMSTNPVTPCGNFSYTLSGSSATITGRARTTLTEVIIPRTFVVNGVTRTVTAIADSAFLDTNIVSVDIPASVTSIGWFSFANCPRLRTVTFRTQGSLSIHAMAFTQTVVTSVRVPIGRLWDLSPTIITGIGAMPIRSVCFNNNGNERCTCCNYRVGDVDGNGSFAMADALAIQRYLSNPRLPSAIQQTVPNGTVHLDALNAARATCFSRAGGLLRLNDSDAIMNRLVGNPSCLNNRCNTSTCRL